MKRAKEGSREIIVRKDRKKTGIGQCQGSWAPKARASGQCYPVLQREVGKD